MKRSIVYIDDEIEALRTFKRMFRREYDVYVTQNQEDVVDLVEKHKPFMVMADQVMSGESGVEVLEKVGRKFPNVMRVLTSGFSDVRAVVDAINKAGVYYYIDKPWSDGMDEATELTRIIKQCEKLYTPDYHLDEMATMLVEAEHAMKLVREMQVFTCLIDTKTDTFIAVSDYFLKKQKCQRDEVVGHKYWEFIVSDIKASEEATEEFQKEGIKIFANKYKVGDGPVVEWVWIKEMSRIDEDGITAAMALDSNVLNDICSQWKKIKTH